MKWEVEITQYLVRTEVFEADTREEAVLIADEQWYGPDWEGYLDSHEVTSVVQVADDVQAWNPDE